MTAVPERVTLSYPGFVAEYSLVQAAPEEAQQRWPGPVVPTSQRAAEVATLTMGGTQQTVGGYGCAAMCAYMVLTQVRPEVTAAEFVQRLNERKGFNILYGREAHLAWDRLPEIYQEYRWFGREDYLSRLKTAEMATVLHAIDDGPVPLWVDFRPSTKGMQSHFVLALRLEGDDIEIVDPWDGAITRLLRRYALQGQDLETAIWGYRWLSVL